MSALLNPELASLANEDLREEGADDMVDPGSSSCERSSARSRSARRNPASASTMAPLCSHTCHSVPLSPCTAHTRHTTR